ncbi:hypothetical protein Adt_05837 [Abeliophyllum distichum]|uniref:Uncharacterized protein n=1 Tax=Abeliophyllum distichum TaxID=126358 RepID=A0ABD1V574_9LAMI
MIRIFTVETRDIKRGIARHISPPSRERRLLRLLFQFILRKASGNKVNLEEVQQTTNKIDQLDKPMVEPVFDEVQIGNGEPSVSEDTVALRKSSKVIRPPLRYDLLITNDALLIEKDEPTTYA